MNQTAEPVFVDSIGRKYSVRPGRKLIRDKFLPISEKHHTRSYYRYLERRRLASKLRMREPINRYKSAVRYAKRFHRKVEISFPDWESMVSQPCFYCGGKLGISGIGLDRIDSGGHYTYDNVRSCCLKCNQAKNDLTEDEFRQWICTVYNNFARNVAK